MASAGLAVWANPADVAINEINKTVVRVLAWLCFTGLFLSIYGYERCGDGKGSHHFIISIIITLTTRNHIM